MASNFSNGITGLLLDPLITITIKFRLQETFRDLDTLQRNPLLLQVTQQSVKVPLPRSVVSRPWVNCDQLALVDENPSSSTDGSSAKKARVVKLSFDLLCNVKHTLRIRHIDELGLVTDLLLLQLCHLVVMLFGIRKDLRGIDDVFCLDRCGQCMDTLA